MSTQIQKLQEMGSKELGIAASSQKPIIKLPGDGVQVTDTATEIYKLAAAQHKLFYSNGRVTRLFKQDQTSLPRLDELQPAQAVSEFEKYAKFSGKKEKPAVLSESTAKLLLACDVARDILPNVRLLLDRPLLMLNGGVIETLGVGYNASSKVLVNAGELKEPETVGEATDFLKNMLADFEFRTDSDISRAMACLLTPAMSIGGFITESTPIHIVEANESQTGKGYLLNLCCLTYGEQAILVVRQKGGTGSLDESFATALLSGRPFIQIDNLRGNLDSQLIEAFVTNPGHISVRVPYSRATAVDGSHRFITITSNGMEATSDLVNRSSFIRLLKEKDRSFTTINGKEMHVLVRENQAQFSGAVAKIIRHYHAQGMPRTCENRHDRREWAQKMDWIVQNIFGLAPLMDGMEAVKARAVNPALVFARSLAIQMEKLGKLGQGFKPSELVDFYEVAGETIPGLDKKPDGDYSDDHRQQRVGQLMKQAMASKAEILIDEQYRVTHSVQMQRTSTGNTYPGNFYKFELVDQVVKEDQPQSEGIQEPQ